MINTIKKYFSKKKDILKVKKHNNKNNRNDNNNNEAPRLEKEKEAEALTAWPNLQVHDLKLFSSGTQRSHLEMLKVALSFGMML